LELPVNIPVTIAYELYQLNADLQPGGLCLRVERYFSAFPYLDAVLHKQQVIKRWLAQCHDHLGSLYFKCRVLHLDSQKLLFSCEDFFEPDPQKRFAIVWRWDPVHKQGVGIALYKEQHN